MPLMCGAGVVRKGSEEGVDSGTHRKAHVPKLPLRPMDEG